MSRKILVLFAHPAEHKSKVNRALRAATEGVANVKVHDLYATYPDFLIDAAHEQALLLEHDLVVVQHPFYWYNAPAILKEWCDIVLEYGFAYGPKGHRLRGKAWLQAISTGGPAAAYQRDGYNRFTIRELLAPWEQTAGLCGMAFLPPQVVHGAGRALAVGALDEAAQRYRRLLEALSQATRPWDELAKLGTVDDMMESL